MPESFSWLNAAFAGVASACAIFTLLDRMTERTPQAIFSEGAIHILNPRGKSIYIDGIYFYGTPLLHRENYDPRTGRYGEPKEVPNYTEKVDKIVPSGGSVKIHVSAYAPEGFDVIKLTLKKKHILNTWILNIHATVGEQPTSK